MKDRLAHSPKETKFADLYEANLKKSPTKYPAYDLTNPSLDQATNNSRLLDSKSHDFQNLKKVTQQSAVLRQTMNNKFFARLQKNQVLELEDEGKNKLNDFLRQTMGSNKLRRVYSDTQIPDIAYSRGTIDQEIAGEDKMPNNKNFQTYRIQNRKEYNAESLKDHQKHNQKQIRNKQFIQEWKNGKAQDKNLLKNVNHHRSPTYLHIDSNKDIEEPLQFSKKNKKDDALNVLTPRVEKANSPSRFNSSPLIQKAKSTDKKLSIPPALGGPSTIFSIKKKPSIASNKNNLIEDFIIGKKLGEGKFGCVNLVKHKRTHGIFALKKIPKNLIKANMMVDQLALEIRIQSCLRHANILEMYGFFDDKTHLYILLQYMDGGTLYEKIKKERPHEKETASIIRQVASAIDYLHDIGIAHRDVKPENIVISHNVYKLCDFGWAAICNQRRKTYCGTFDYVAPEILEGVQYDLTVDLWCLGVLTFELLTGKAPFYHISRKQTMKKILNVQNDSLVFPEGMSEIAKDFIDKLIKKDPSQRISASQALLHPFLKVQQDYT